VLLGQDSAHARLSGGEVGGRVCGRRFQNHRLAVQMHLIERHILAQLHILKLNMRRADAKRRRGRLGNGRCHASRELLGLPISPHYSTKRLFAANRRQKAPNSTAYCIRGNIWGTISVLTKKEDFSRAFVVSHPTGPAEALLLAVGRSADSLTYAASELSNLTIDCAARLF